MGITCVEEFVVTRANLSASVLYLWYQLDLVSNRKWYYSGDLIIQVVMVDRELTIQHKQAIITTQIKYWINGMQVKGQSHQAALLSAALTRKAAAAVSVGINGMQVTIINSASLWLLWPRP